MRGLVSTDLGGDFETSLGERVSFMKKGFRSSETPVFIGV